MSIHINTSLIIHMFISIAVRNDQPPLDTYEQTQQLLMTSRTDQISILLNFSIIRFFHGRSVSRRAGRQKDKRYFYPCLLRRNMSCTSTNLVL
jgi:hypothetical protein